MYYITLHHVCTHTHTQSLSRYDVIPGMKLELCYEERADGKLIFKKQPRHSRSIKCLMENRECWLTFYKLPPACLYCTQLRPATIMAFQKIIKV